MKPQTAVHRRWLLVSMALLLVACETNPITGRTQVMLVPDSALIQQSSLAYQQVLGEAKKARVLDTHHAQTQRVRRIAQRLIAEAKALRPETQAWQWEVHLLDVDEVNAWCMAGGKMAVYTGLLKAIKPTDAELAVVMGHEIAHAVLSHQAEGASTSVLTGIGLQAACVAEPSLCAGATGQLTGLVAELGILRPHGRSQEMEADEIGLMLSASAGYDPHASLTLWRKMAQAGGGRVPEFLSTHPSPENRQQHLAQLAEQLMPVYERARQSRTPSGKTQQRKGRSPQ